MSPLLRPGLVLLLFLPLCTPVQARTLSLYTFDSPPYQVQPADESSNGAVLGTTVETVNCIADRLNWRTDIRAVPQARAIYGLRNGLVDGYFAADESDQLDRFGLATAPIALEKWYFYSLQPIDDMDDMADARIAAVADSNEARWLDQGNYSATMTVSYPEQLLALLYRGRVDAILMDERVMALQRSNGYDVDQLHRRFVRFAPLSLYLSERFILENPFFLASFNQAIEGCVANEFTLSEAELGQVSAKARALLDNLAHQMDPAMALATGAPLKLMDDVLRIDADWQALAPARASDEAMAVIGSPVSGKLSLWQYQQTGTVSEVLLMDAIGANVAISELTSDYWQGDEQKFRAIAGEPPGTLYLGPLRFDPSTRRFQVFASVPVHDPDSGRFIGGVAIGLDIEKALQSSLPAARVP